MKTKPDHYVKDRHIGRNMRLVKDIMKLTSLDNISGGTIFFDFKKKPLILKIEISLLKSARCVFNFGPQIRKWIKTLYTDISSCAINNGHASEFINQHIPESQEQKLH